MVYAICGIVRRRAVNDFCNIAEGTHEGNITMKAYSAISARNLVLAAGTDDGSVKVAELGDKPLGVSADCAEAGEMLGVALPGCAGSTLLCVAGDEIAFGSNVYTKASGKVGATAEEGSFKIGVALSKASNGETVEVDPLGFGSSAYQVLAFGQTDWAASNTSQEIFLNGIDQDDSILAYVQTAAAGESVVGMEIMDGKFSVELDKAGTPSTTKITWLVLRKN